ncbi:MAG: hypothetical protein AB1665_05070 [Candidatus Thermoplasmatota archaeon]
MRFVKLSQEWIMEVNDLYTSVMGHACKGLFFREGLIAGREIAALAKEGEYFETAAKLLIGRGWVEHADFEDDKVVVRGSIEAVKGKTRECTRLRGLMKGIYEEVAGMKINITEQRCEGRGDPHCVFAVQKGDRI